MSAEQQKVVQFKPDASTVHAEWVAVRTYSWVPPCPPEPITRRRMLRHNSIEAWETAQDRLEVLSPACPLMSEGGAGEGTRRPSLPRRLQWCQRQINSQRKLEEIWIVINS